MVYWMVGLAIDGDIHCRWFPVDVIRKILRICQIVKKGDGEVKEIHATVDRIKLIERRRWIIACMMAILC